MPEIEFYKLVDKKVVPCASREEGYAQFDIDKRSLFLTGNDQIRVSTIFLVIDQGFWSTGPVLFETMVFGGTYDREQERYTSYDEAEAGHKAWVEKVFKFAGVKKEPSDA